MALSREQKNTLKNAFTLFKPEQLGLTYPQFHELKKTMRKQPPLVILNEIKRRKRKNELKQKLREQKEEEEKIGFENTVLPSPDTLTRKVDLMYPDDTRHSMKGILCQYGEETSNKKRCRIQIKEGSPERRHYIPGQKIRPQQEDAEPKLRNTVIDTPPPRKTKASRIKSAISRICKPMMACSGTSLVKSSSSEHQNVTPPRKFKSPESARPCRAGVCKLEPCRAEPSTAGDYVYYTPPHQRIAHDGISKPKRKPISQAEEDMDKDILSNYLNTIPKDGDQDRDIHLTYSDDISSEEEYYNSSEEEEGKIEPDLLSIYLDIIPVSRNTPVDLLKKIKPGSVIEIID